MVRYALIVLAVLGLACVTLAPDEALARRGGGGGAYRGGAVQVRGSAHAGHYRGAGRAHVSNPIVRHPVARTAARRGVYRGAAYGAAAVGAAAAGAAYYNGYNNNGCYRDAYGNWICPNQYPY